jgi:hypothetical protein
MGYACTWLAVREEFAERLLSQLELEPTGESEEFPESLMSTAALQSGWRVLWHKEYCSTFMEEDTLARLSTEYDVLCCAIEEHVMASSAELWSGGERKWWISHEGIDGPKGLSTEGAMPDGFVETKAEMEREQLAAGGEEADVDYLFEIAPLLAQGIVGFKHDEEPDLLGDSQFIVLRQAGRSRGFWSRLLGR